MEQYPYLYEGMGLPDDFSVFIVGGREDLPELYNYRHVYVSDVNPKDVRHRVMYNYSSDGKWIASLIRGADIANYFREVKRLVKEIEDYGAKDLNQILWRRIDAASRYIVHDQHAESLSIEVKPLAQPTEEIQPIPDEEQEALREQAIKTAVIEYPRLPSQQERLDWANKHSPIIGAGTVSNIDHLLGFYLEHTPVPAPVPEVAEDPYKNLTTIQHLSRLCDRKVLEIEALGRVLVAETDVLFRSATQGKIEDLLSELNKLVQFLDENLEYTYCKYKNTILQRKTDQKEFFIVDPWYRNFNMNTGQFQHALRDRHKSQTVNFYINREKLNETFNVIA